MPRVAAERTVDGMSGFLSVERGEGDGERETERRRPQGLHDMALTSPWHCRKTISVAPESKPYPKA